MNSLYLSNVLSANMSETPEGYLLCSNVPIARTGIQTYTSFDQLTDIHGNTLPLSADGKLEVFKSAEVLFDKETISSFEGKPITIGHTMVNTNNWRQNAVGIARNVRQGNGKYSNKLVADLLFMDKNAIDIVKSKTMREISLGYDAGYLSDGAGKAHQLSIRGNHIALVPLGKAGHECRIFDEKSNLEAKYMTFKEKLKKLFCDAVDDSTTFDEIIKENPTAVKDDEKAGTKTEPSSDAKTGEAKTGDALFGQMPPQQNPMPPQQNQMAPQQNQMPPQQNPIGALNAKLDQILAILAKIAQPGVDKGGNPPQPTGDKSTQPPAGNFVSLDPEKPMMR